MVHFRPSLVLRILSHRSFRSAAHCLHSRPCKTHFCSNGVSVIMVLSMAALPRAWLTGRSLPTLPIPFLSDGSRVASALRSRQAGPVMFRCTPGQRSLGRPPQASHNERLRELCVQQPLPCISPLHSPHPPWTASCIARPLRRLASSRWTRHS